MTDLMKPTNPAADRKKQIAVADIQLFLLAIIWGGGFVAGKIALETTTPFYQISYRYTGAALCLLIPFLRNVKSLDRKTLLTGMGIGALMFLGNSFQAIGLQYTTPAKQSFIVSSYTIIVPLLSFLVWREKPSKQTAFAAVLAMIGIGILTLNKNLSMEFGDFLTLIFAFLFSIQVILTGRFVKQVNISLYTFITLATASLLSIAGALLLEVPVLPADISGRSWLGLIYLAVFNSAAAYYLQNCAQRWAPASHTALIMSLEAVFGTIFAILFVGETFTARKITGCTVMFAAILLSKIPIPVSFRKQSADTTDTTLPSEPKPK